jgi:starvation-inducible DNA-binding protein
MSDENCIARAKELLADGFKFYIKAHNYHWNVVGPTFGQLHELLQGIYEDVFASLDILAEHIRAMDSEVPGSYSRFEELSRISDERESGLSWDVMLRRLLSDNEIMLSTIKMAYDAAEAAGNHGLSNFLAERQSQHMKHGWMLKATLS